MDELGKSTMLMDELAKFTMLHTCQELWTEICEIRHIFKVQLTKIHSPVSSLQL